MSIIGYDIGGAHLKAARVESGRIVAVAQEACALWQGMDRLEAAFDAIATRFGPADRAVATMTGELVDLFGSRAEGVARLSAAAEARHPGLLLYAGKAGFVATGRAADAADSIASANWHATATLQARETPDALVVDMGSTTTDLVPLKDGRVAARGTTDADRLAVGELVYTGATRTPLMAVAAEVPVHGARVGVMAEYFANMADVNRLLGILPEGTDQHPTADGRGKSVAESRLRLSRMVGRDVTELSEDGWRGVAGCFAEAQLRRVHDAALTVLSAADLAMEAPVVACGTGRFVVIPLAGRLGRPAVEWGARLPVPAHLRAAAVSAAPAVAVALLADGPG